MAPYSRDPDPGTATAPVEGASPSTRADLARVQEDLRRLGYRMTPQREAILQMFELLPDGAHLSAEELHERLQEGDSGISLATTYRTLKLLASIGLLRELDFAEGHKHYELSTPQAAPHHHLVCVSCSRAIEFEETGLYGLGLDVASTHGFRMVDVQYKVFGVCPACQERRPDQRPELRVRQQEHRAAERQPAVESSAL